MPNSVQLKSFRVASGLKAIFLGGALAGVLDGVDAAVIIPRLVKVRPVRVFQFIASGILGPKAFHGGLTTAMLGCLLQLSIATGAAAIYYVFALKLKVLLKRPFVFGPVFGLAVFVFMQNLVVPLSAAPRQPPLSGLVLLNNLLSHLLLVGLPIALLASRSFQSRSTKNPRSRPTNPDIPHSMRNINQPGERSAVPE
jgi:hypothetical protein